MRGEGPANKEEAEDVLKWKIKQKKLDNLVEFYTQEKMALEQKESHKEFYTNLGIKLNELKSAHLSSQ